MVQVNDITIFKGEAIAATFTVQPASEGDITGRTYTFTLKSRATDPVALLTKACPVIDGPNRKFQLTLTKLQTVALSADDYDYDIWRVDSGSEACVSVGTFRVLQGVLNP